jgi:hypothetical protein
MADYNYRQVLSSFDVGEITAALGIKPSAASTKNVPSATVTFRKRLNAAEEAALDLYFQHHGFERVQE